MPKATDLTSYIASVREAMKKNPIDLSTGEDLSIGIMNVVSLEEHLFFTYEKTRDEKYLPMLDAMRELRKDLMRKIVKNPHGEEWCISKHLLAGAMRLFEVGTKHLHDKNMVEAKDFFDKSYSLYSLFWALRLDVTDAQKITTDAKNLPAGTDHDKNFKKLLNELMDCCKE